MELNEFSKHSHQNLSIPYNGVVIFTYSNGVS